jgi:hypothetical protein
VADPATTGERPAVDRPLAQLVERLQKAYGAGLASVVLYGSAASGDHHAKFSDLNVLVILAAVTARELAAAQEIFRWWRERGNPSPLLITEAEAAASADCFAIEFTDIRRQHRVLFGKPLTLPPEPDRRYYRVQVEHDLRAKLLRLRQKAAGTWSDDDLLRRLLADSVSTFCVLFRHALALHGVDAPPVRREVLARAGERFGIDTTPFERLLDLREERIKPRDVNPAAVLGAYLAAISAVVDAVDRLEH